MNCACQEENGKIAEPCSFHGKWLEAELRAEVERLCKWTDDQATVLRRVISEREAALLQVEAARKLTEAASGVLSPCDDSEKERGFCVGHGQINRLPCEFADLREALAAFNSATGADKRTCEHLFVNYQCEKCGVGQIQS